MKKIGTTWEWLENGDLRTISAAVPACTIRFGINLTSADTVILHDLDPNPTHDKQAEDRAHRIGQTKQVTVYRLVMEGTVDQHILEKSESKAKLNTSVLQDGVPDPFKDADDDGKKGNKEQRSMNSLIERALAQHGMGKE